MAPPIEISIPSTSLSTPDDGSKPFTLYNITLRLPLRSFVVQKRFADFVRLHYALLSRTGSATPSCLPAKAWFRSTVSSPQLTRQRQLGLETYLRAIAESPDRRWRDSPDWRAFLSLPPSAANSTVSAPGLITGPTDPTVWLDQYRDAKACLNETRLCLARRDAAADADTSAAAVAEAGAAAKRALLRAGALIIAMTEGLRAMDQAGNRAAGDGEIRRRNDTLADLRSDRDLLDRLSQTIATSDLRHARSNTINPQPSSSWAGRRTAHDRPALMSTSPAAAARAGLLVGSRVIGAPAVETDRTREQDNDGLLQQQKQEMAAQDTQLDLLVDAIKRQKQLALELQLEVDIHNEMLDMVDHDLTRVGAKVKVASSRIKKISS